MPRTIKQPIWRIELYDVKKPGQLGYLTDISNIFTTSLTIKKDRNKPDEVSFTLDLSQLQNRAKSLGMDPRQVIEPYRHNVKIYRNNKYITQAIVQKVSVNLNNQGKNTVEVSCIDMLGLLEKRLIHQDYGGGSWADFAARAIMDAQHEPNRIYNYAWEGDGTDIDNAWFRGWKFTPGEDLAQQFPEWIAGKKYNPYDKCTYKGKFWECNELHVSEEKFQESKWVELGNIIDETTGEAIPIYGVWREDNEKEGPTGTMLGGWAGTSSCHMTAQTLTYNTPQQGSISLANSAVSTSLVAPFSKDLGRLYCRIMARKISTGGATSPWGKLGRIYFTNYLNSDWSTARWMDIDTNLYEVQAYNSIDGTGTNLWQGATVEPAYGTTPYAGYTANHTYATDGNTSTAPAVRSTNDDYQGTIGTWYATTSVATPVDVKSIRIHYGTAAKTQVAVRTGTGKNLFSGEYSQSNPYTITATQDSFGHVANLVNGKTYTISCKTNGTWGSSGNTVRLGIKYVSSQSTISLSPDSPVTFTATATGSAWVTFIINGSSRSVSFWDIQIEEGSTATDYEPYTGTNEIYSAASIPASSTDTSVLIQDPYYAGGEDLVFKFFIEGYGGDNHWESQSFTVTNPNDWTEVEYTFPQMNFDIYRFGIKIVSGEGVFDSPVCYKEQIEGDEWDLGIRLGDFPSDEEQLEAGWTKDRFTPTYEWKKALETLQDLSNMDSDNFWFFLDENYRFNIYIYGGTDVITLDLSYPKNITSMTVDTNAVDMVNYMKGDGSAEIKQDPLVSGVENFNPAPFTWVGYDMDKMRDYWPLAAAQSFNSERTIENLKNDIASEITTFSKMLDVPQIKVENGTIDPEQIALGDVVSVTALNTPYVQRINGLYKVIGYQIDTDLNSVENISLTLIVPTANQLNALSFPELIKNFMVRVKNA